MLQGLFRSGFQMQFKSCRAKNTCGLLHGHILVFLTLLLPAEHRRAGGAVFRNFRTTWKVNEDPIVEKPEEATPH